MSSNENKGEKTGVKKRGQGAGDERGGFKVGLCQPNAKLEVQENLRLAEDLVKEARSQGADLVIVPENFAYMGPEEDRVALAEVLEVAAGEADDGDEGDEAHEAHEADEADKTHEAHGPILSWARRVVREQGCWLLLGGIPERSPDPKRAYNTAALLDPRAAIQAKYHKMHLFDLYPEDAPAIVESASTFPGEEVVVASTPWLQLGLLCAPAAFTSATGQAHWKTLVRARAVENLSFVAAANLCGQHYPGRASYGHSRIVDPWGDVLASLGDEEGVCVAELDPARLVEVRKKLPALKHRRL